MDNWTKLKNLYIQDHESKEYLVSPQIRLNAIDSLEKLFQVHFPHIIKQPKFLKQITKEKFMKEVSLKKGLDLNGAEISVINGLYNFLPQL
jgi:hypothetical protein